MKLPKLTLFLAVVIVTAAEPGTGPDKLVFNCEGGTNINCAVDQHMHRGELTLIDEDHMLSKWFMLDKGENTYTADFKLVRRK